MQFYNQPQKKEWLNLVKRIEKPKNDLQMLVSDVFGAVIRDGDEAVGKYTKLFDGADLDQFAVTDEEINASDLALSPPLKEAINIAYKNIYKFHLAQKEHPTQVETTKGVFCWRESRPILNVGLYIPGGTAPLFSSVLMLGIPAQIAGCENVILCTPPDKYGNIHPAIIYSAKLCNISKIFKVGGIQAIAAMSLGTKTIDKVDKIFGPGNQYVTAAKQYALNYGVAIDLPAGPSELLIIADGTCNPDFVAADLLSQAEHGTDSQVILLSNSHEVIKKVQDAIQNQIVSLPRKEAAIISINNSRCILLESLSECVEFSNLYAPEHLILATQNAFEISKEIKQAGSVFMGNYSCESAGDYASGTNHTLPTNGFAKNYSGVSLDSFIKKITFQNITELGIKNLGRHIEVMAEAEELIGHKNAVSIRLDFLKSKA